VTSRFSSETLPMNLIRIVIFAKAPVPGQVKTRLIPALGEVGAARLSAHMLDLTLSQALEAGIGPVELCMSPAPGTAAWADTPLPAGIEISDQGGGDLGERMARAARRTLAIGESVLLIGTDCPDLSAERLRTAATHLAGHDAVLHRAVDGGYPLLGLSAFDAGLFQDMPWSTSAVADLTLARLAVLGWRVWLGDTLRDVDEPGDLTKLPETLRTA